MDFTKAKERLSKEEMLRPLSPISELLSTPILPLNILIVFQGQAVFSNEQVIQLCHDRFLNFDVRFSSIIDIDHKGIRRWKKVHTMVEDHIKYPTFPVGLSPSEYDKLFHEYISKIAMEPFPEGRPLWEIHVFNYPTLHGSMSGVFRFNHVIGDGYSLMNLAFHAFERADNPSLPLTLPNLSLKFKGWKSNYWGLVSMCLNTVWDIGSIFSKATALKDQPSAIRSMKPELEYDPIDVSPVTISLQKVKQIKSRIDGTVNDVITGLIYYGIHLYMRKMGKDSRGARVTAKVMFNTRAFKGYNTVEEMLTQGEWGNQAGFLQIPIPTFNIEKKVNPIDFITIAQENTNRMKKSTFGYFIIPILKSVKLIKGLAGMAKFAHAGFMNTSLTITNMIGPNEQMALVGNPVNNFYFFVAGIPQSLVFSVISYMGNVKLVATTERDFIDSQILVTSMNEAFESMFEAICG